MSRTAKMATTSVSAVKMRRKMDALLHETAGFTVRVCPVSGLEAKLRGGREQPQ